MSKRTEGMMEVDILLYEGFTALDAFGPAEVLGRVAECTLRYVSMEGGMVGDGSGLRVETVPLGNVAAGSVLLIPGGMGNRRLVDDDMFLQRLRTAAEAAGWVLCVCTGSALLARTDCLDGRAATSNSHAFDWV